MEIVVIRHAETIDNLNSVCQGHRDGVLSSNGIEQAKLLSEKLQNEEFDLVICSDLKRAVDTANIVFGRRCDLNVIYDKRLRERFMGHVQGQKLDINMDYNSDIEGMENISDVFSRVEELLQEVKRKYTNHRIVIVSHGITIKALLALCESKDIRDVKLMGNCSVNRVEI